MINKILKNNSKDGKFLPDSIRQWVPFIGILLGAFLFVYKAWEIQGITQIKGGDFITEVSIRNSKAFFAIYVLGALLNFSLAFGFLLWRGNINNLKQIIFRANWTVERLAYLEERDKTNHTTNTRGETHWPWGTHHTAALGDLEEAAKRFWALYDPADPSTAPTNEMVAGWLRDERGVSKEKAAAIASILRADGLRPGPRR
jgi:hypothetical protein